MTRQNPNLDLKRISRCYFPENSGYCW